MNIFRQITYRTMKQSRIRTAVTIVGVILSTAMITAVTTFGYSFWSFLRDYSMEHDGSWYGAAYHVSGEELARIRSDERVETAAATDIMGFAVLGSLTSENMPYLFIQSLPEEVWEMCPVVLEEGRLPQNDGEVILPLTISANLKEGKEIQIGDELTLQAGERMLDGERLPDRSSYMTEETESSENSGSETLNIQREIKVTVVGIYSQGSDIYQPASYSVLAGPSGSGSLSGYHDVYIRTCRPAEIYDFMETVECEGSVFNWGVLRWLGAADNDNVAGIMLGLISVIIGIIMAGSVSLIYNAFSISLRERTVQFGLLSSVGATRKQLSRALRYEASAVSLIGIPLGCIAGTAGIGVTLHFIGGGLANLIQGEEMDVPLRISWISILTAVVIAAFTVMISVWIPCLRLRTLSPMEALRSGKDIRIRAKDVKISGLSYRIFGFPGMMARKNYRRDRRKYRSTIASLTMSILLFVSVSSFGQYLITTGSFVMEMPDVQLLYDSYDESPEEAYRQTEQARELISSNDNVTFIQEYTGFRQTFLIEAKQDAMDKAFTDAGLRSGYMSLSEEGAVFLEVSLCVLPDDVFENTAEGACADSGKGLPVLYPDSVKVKDPVTQKYEKGMPLSRDMGTVKLEMEEFSEDGENIREPVCEIEPQGGYEKAPRGVSYSDFGITLLTSRSGYETYLMQQEEKLFPYYELGIQCEDHAQVYRELSEKLEKSGNEGIFYDNAADYEQNRQILTALSVLSYGFVILISLIAVANVFNTISTNLMLRRKEFAMLRSVGMDRIGFRKMMCYECMIYGVRSLIYGIFLSLAVSMLIWQMLSGGVDTEYIVPWKYLVIASASVFFVVGVTMLYTMRLIQRENIIDELKMD